AILCSSHASKEVKNFVLTKYSTQAAPVNAQLSSIGSQLRTIFSNNVASFDSGLACVHSHQLLSRCRCYLLAENQSYDDPAVVNAVVRGYLLHLIEQCPAGMASLLIRATIRPEILQFSDNNCPSNKAIIDSVNSFVRLELLREQPTIGDLHLALLCIEPDILLSLLGHPNLSAIACPAIKSAFVRLSETSITVSDNRLSLNLPESLAWLRGDLVIATVAKQLRAILASPLPQCVRILHRLELLADSGSAGLSLLLQS
uniref:RAB3GAP2_C domain-containing protein n=1 Tax=Macrostomum lignano TaxID=282301 RepID=A0A1I8JNX3_9PLAT